MQRGWIERTRAGWRGGWREDGRKCYTPVTARKGDAHTLLLREVQRVSQGIAPPLRLTLFELVDRFESQHDTSPKNRIRIAGALLGPLELWGDLPLEDITPERISRWLTASNYRPSTKQTYLRILRQVFHFATANGLAAANPATRVKTPVVGRSDRLCPFESWDEVDRVAAEAGRWWPFVILAVDTGARPSELARLQHRHVRGARVYLPGTKTRNAERVVTLTARGLAAYHAIPRSATTPLVFHTNGRPIDIANWRKRVWRPALELAGLKYRGVYQTRHTFAYFSLLASVPLSDLACEMGHASSAFTHTAYGHWSDRMGDRAARLRATWAADAQPNPREARAPQMPHTATRSERAASTFSAR